MFGSWRSSLLDIAINDCTLYSKEDLKNFSVYQFGVFNGGSMCEIASILNRHKIEVNTFYGFDVFTGMPKETAEPIYQDSWNPDIMPDAFNVLKCLDLKTPDDCAKIIQDKVQSVFLTKGNSSGVSIISGLVEDTLPQQENLSPAFYIDFDMDIYSPTKYAFNYLMENNLIVPGTLIGYDDWGGTPGFEKFENGESRAHKEIVNEWGISLEKIYQNGNSFPHVQTVWIVREI